MDSFSKEIDYIFITDPGDSLKCRICLEVARDPKQCEDCGKLFCSECIEKYERKLCPNCRKENPRYFKDVRGARDIKELGVRCNNMERGCGWTGTIGTLEKHMSTCQFALVPCPNKCEDDRELTIMRKDLDKHLKKKCPNRAYQCQHCGEKGTYASITEDHDKVCDKKRVQCPNKESGCRLSVERGKIKQHVKSACDYTEVACAYKSLGCTVRMLRKDMKKHQDDDKVHVRLALNIISSLKDQHTTLSEGEAMVFKVTQYTRMKKKNEKFNSPSFYTHPGGYKMCVSMYANGNGTGAGTHVSVFFEILESPHDDHLHWPFIGTVTCELLNQLADDKHHRHMDIFDSSDNIQVGSSKGRAKFLSHSSLSYDPATNTQYLLDDTLYFRVSVTVANHKSWLVCTDKINMDTTRAIKDSKTLKDGEPMVFKVTGYKDKKITDITTTNTDSFYTGPGGYKMCINVDANGDDSGRGTHVSVFAVLLEGAYDASLSWPFTGTVIITLLNQLADDNHHSNTLQYEGTEFGTVGQSWGYSQFISHSALSHDPVKNTQYLKDDTLYFRVTVTVKDHKPWLLCTHHS